MPISKCATCDYEWPTGQDGDHSCSEQLRARLKALEPELVNAVHGMGMEIAELKAVDVQKRHGQNENVREEKSEGRPRPRREA